MVSRRIRAFGLVVAIDTDDARLFPLLERQLPPFPSAAEGDAADARYRVSAHAPGQILVIRGRRTIATAFDLERACDRLVADLQSWLGRLAAGWTFIHAGVVSIDGRVLLLPAHSGAGKTTLVAALLRVGASYGSDEFAVLDRDGFVHPYSRQLAQRSGERHVSATDFGATTMTEPLRVASIVFTRFQPNATSELTRVPPGEAVLRLLEHCPGARERPEETLRTLRLMASDVPAFAGMRGEANAMAKVLVAPRLIGHS